MATLRIYSNSKSTIENWLDFLTREFSSHSGMTSQDVPKNQLANTGYEQALSVTITSLEDRDLLPTIADKIFAEYGRITYTANDTGYDDGSKRENILVYV